MTVEPLTFDKFQPGALIGRDQLVVERPLLELWDQVYPQSRQPNLIPLGMLSVIMMRAHSQIVQPRPSGNIHLGQQFEVRHPIEIGQTMLASVTCKDKRMSGARKLVSFSIAIADAMSGRALLDGVNTMFWAA